MRDVLIKYRKTLSLITLSGRTAEEMPFDKIILLRRGRGGILRTLLAKAFLDMLVNPIKYLKSSG